MLNLNRLTPTKLGCLCGLLTSSIVGFIYIVLLQEPAWTFYVFAFFALIGGPLLAGIIAISSAPERKIRSALAATGIVFGVVLALFIFIYAIFIRVETKRVQIPVFCDGTYAMSALPSDRTYILPDGTKGILLLSDAQTTIAAKVDQTLLPRPTTLFLINNMSKTILGSITFANDIVAVSMDASTIHFLHEGLGHQIHKATGTYEPYFLTMDAYGTNTDGFFETTGVFSSWSADGNVKLRSHFIYNGIAQGCYIDGAKQSVTKL